MNIFKVVLIIAAICILLALAYEKGWLGPKKEIEECKIATESYRSECTYK